MTQAAEAAGGAPRSLDEQVPHREMSQAEIEATFPDEAGEIGVQERIEAAVSGPTEENPPDWASVPPGLKIPVGKKVMHIRLRASWTEAPQKGDRVLVLWSLSEREEQQGYQRARGDGARSMAELTKAMVRAIDGVPADWTGKLGPGNVNLLWSEVGTKCRQMLQNLYLKTHSLSQEEQLDFFANCVSVTSSVAT